ncbi:hypothetical protein GPECTOR_9g725 [Gonium pectorale]|uniref:Uncharacterized protein n=1 Tax=Gonium pectorale TaxID=33097 RepID=A0A150GS31_GONPE|nr:hypothetical protein GPECTOR_9g725 [Gonium pectorale]|eukprot:KXZ52679.1 hypothetical protein GPECTOR_9g725 [Gonium pectorale]
MQQPEQQLPYIRGYVHGPGESLLAYDSVQSEADVSPDMVAKVVLAASAAKRLRESHALQPSPEVLAHIERDAAKAVQASIRKTDPTSDTTLQRILNEMTEMNTKVAEMSTEMGKMGTEMRELHQKMGQMGAELKISDNNNFLRLLNARVEGLQQPIHMLKKPVTDEHGALGSLPAAGLFPANRHQLQQVTHEKITALSTFYGESFGDGVEDLAVRKTLLAAFLGVRA